MYPIKRIRSNFPMIKNNLIYLDNASSTYKPISMIKNITNIYKNEYAPYKRSFYNTSINITNKIENVRKFIANFINVEYEEIIFTKGSTESINLIANSWGRKFLSNGDNIIISEIEHHSNILPWKLISKEIGIEIRILPININNGNLDINFLKKNIDKKTKLLTFTHVSNVLGILNPAKMIISLAKEINKNIIILLDGSQSIMHCKIDIKELNCDFYTFSGHKIYGPLGVGILYGKNNLLKKMNPWEVGGSMIKYVDFNSDEIYMESPWKFEAGSINISSIIGLKTSIEYINKIGIYNINNWEYNLTTFTIELLKNIKNIILYGKSENRIGIISFNIKNINDYDIGIILDKYKICIRTGHHCAIPLMNLYNVKGMCRISYAMYTNYDDILFFIDKLKYIINLF